MKKQAHISAFGFLSLLLIICSRPAAIAQEEVDDQSEFDYVKGSSKGPDKWGVIHEEWATCKYGDEQSPIDLMNKRVELQWAGSAGSLQSNGINYDLQQCHWHSPSEHTINGKRFALELHMVHQIIDPILGNRTAVIGILYKIGRPEAFLSELEKDIKSITDSQKEINVGIVDPRHIKVAGKKYYRYIGSLTTPPCTEGVLWTISKRVRTVSIEQVKLLRTAVHDSAENNARPLQPLNDRDILFYKLKERPG
ncbi:hypothetical protein IFM89_016336 [Coptis chinensis]|uniref:Carbonic anhydrase n=1 Tax=Coptis chinensis TaxID=261450 RepID=A0A835HDN8_9MAGN|nr:hypothetical protein IFM89_016336 [Coptis chinensis]